MRRFEFDRRSLSNLKFCFFQVDLDDLEILPGFENHNSNLRHEAAGVVSLSLEYLSPQLLFSTGALPWLNQTNFILGQVFCLRAKILMKFGLRWLMDMKF